MLESVEYSRAPAHGNLSSTRAKSFCAMRYGFFSSPTVARESAFRSSVNTTCGARSSRNGASSRRRDAGVVRLRVVRVQRFQGAVAELRRLGATRHGLRAQPPEVTDGAIEVTLVAIDRDVLEQPLVPLRELVLAQVGDLLLHLRAHLGLGQGEVEADAAHALALEQQCVALVGRGGRR